MKYFTKKIHLVGIGGAGMSPLAEVLQHHGHTITGSDRARSNASTRLESIGIKVQYNHVPELVENADLLVYSSAVREDNPERVYARERGIPSIRRADLLGELMRQHFTICISGTHGKTTTTSLIGSILHDAGTEPTVLVGGMLRSKDSHAVVGTSNVMVAEADEYDRSFLVMYPSMAIITNIEADHLDCYGNLENIKDAFVQFSKRVPFYGALVVCKDDPGVRELLPLFERTIITYGITEDADYKAVNITFSAGISSFTVQKNKKVLGSVNLNIPGRHNVLNALGSIALANELGIPFASIAKTLSEFQGVRRRFEIIGVEKGVTVIDDYAHHPGEIRATLDAARTGKFKRVIAVFQPHLYTRTRDFMDDFASNLAVADVIYITDIYKAREEPIPGVSSEVIAEKISASGKTSVHYVPSKENIISQIASDYRDGDAVVVMGAGDIWEIAPVLLGKIKNG
jgi:UDP-N-acetylmuramate--alanine ligase